MDLFIKLGLEAYKEGEDFTIDAPLTNFKMAQYYRKDVTKSVFVKYKGKQISLRIAVGKNDKLDKTKIASATSPNVVHMLDSQIVAGIMLHGHYTVSCIHDSFSTHACDGGKLFEDARTVFVDLFNEDILAKMLRSLGKESYLMEVEYGTLDVNDVVLNDYNFS